MYPRHRYVNQDPTAVPDVVASPKIDGAFYFLRFDKEGSPRFFSRRMSVTGKPIERTASLPHLANIKLPQYAGHIIGAELYFTGQDKDGPEQHNVLSGILNSLPQRARDQQKIFGPIRLAPHDVIKPKLATYKDKINYLQKFVEDVNRPDVVHLPEYHFGPEAVKKLIDTTRREGKEGIIATSLSIPETINVRYKVKHRLDYNLRILGIEQEHDIYGKPKPSMGALMLGDATGVEVGRVGTGFDHATRREIWNNKKKYLNKPAKVSAMPPVRSIKDGGKLKMMVFLGWPDNDRIDTVP